MLDDLQIDRERKERESKYSLGLDSPARPSLLPAVAGWTQEDQSPFDQPSGGAVDVKTD
jgi:hypothetical protein